MFGVVVVLVIDGDVVVLFLLLRLLLPLLLFCYADVTYHTPTIAISSGLAAGQTVAMSITTIHALHVSLI